MRRQKATGALTVAIVDGGGSGAAIAHCRTAMVVAFPNAPLNGASNYQQVTSDA